jgi:hypothetical protein
MYEDRSWKLDLTLNGSDENSYKGMVVLIPQVARELGLPPWPGSGMVRGRAMQGRAMPCIQDIFL